MILDIISKTAVHASSIYSSDSLLVCAKFGYARHQNDLPPDLKGSYKTMIVCDPFPFSSHNLLTI